jgi:hypothetical protein
MGGFFKENDSHKYEVLCVGVQSRQWPTHKRIYYYTQTQVHRETVL